jgi:hypothetical protein
MIDWLTDWLIMPRSRVLLEKLRVTQLVKKYHAFYLTWRFHCCVHKSPLNLVYRPIYFMLRTICCMVAISEKIDLGQIWAPCKVWVILDRYESKLSSPNKYQCSYPIPIFMEIRWTVSEIKHEDGFMERQDLIITSSFYAFRARIV